jgi:hypothetical protein
MVPVMMESEKSVLHTFLRYQRAAVLAVVDGLDEKALQVPAWVRAELGQSADR